MSGVFVSFASAALSRSQVASFGPDGAGGSESFEAVRGVATDQNGDVYVFDAAKEAIYKFDAAGAPVNFSATGTNAITSVPGTQGREDELAIAPTEAPGGGTPPASAGDIYLANNSTVLAFAPSGAPLPSFGEGETCGVATNAAGHVFVGSYSETITEYVPAGTAPTNADKTATGTASVGLCNVAVDGLGQVFAANFGGSSLARLTNIADTAPTIVEPAGSTLATDATGNNLFVDAGGEVREYDSSGGPLATFGEGRLTESLGIAVNAAQNEVYVSTGTGGKVAIFGNPVVVPSIVAEAATGVALKKARLHGSINPSGTTVTSCVFEYFPESEPSASQTTPCVGTIPADGSDHPIEAQVSGLAAETTYTVRIVAHNAAGEARSNTEPFRTGRFAEVDPATDLTKETARLNGVVIPEGSTIESCVFEYGETALVNAGGALQTASCEQSGGAIGTGNAPVPVSAGISGLSPGTEYTYQLSVTVGGTARFSQSASFDTAGPLLETAYAANVGVTQAELLGQFNPRNEADLYVFECTSEAQFALTGWAGATQAPEGGATAPQVDQAVQVVGTAKGLAPKTTYRFRLVVESPAGSFISSEGVFTTFSGQGVAGLPDNRAYEQASPVEKNGNSIQGAPNHVSAAAHGARITYYVGGGIPGGNSSTDLPSYVSTRGTESWTTKGILPPRTTGPRGAVVGWNEDLTTIYTTNFQFLGGPVKGNLYEGNTETGAFGPVATGLPELSPKFIDNSGDGSIVAFEEPLQGPSESVFSRADGKVHLASVLNDGSLPEEGAVAGPYNWFGDPNGENGGVQGTYYVRAEHALSNSGNRLYFTGVASHAVYARTNPATEQSALAGGKCSEPEKACTAEVSKGQPAAFIGASPDGTAALILSHAALTGDATTGPSEEGNDLYLYEADGEKLEDLTVDEEPGDPAGAEVVGVVGHSDDMSTIYFVANGTLAAGATKGNCNAGSQEHCNLYVWHQGTVSFVGPLKGGEDFDQYDWKPVSGVSETQPSGQVSPNGKAVLFSSVVDQETGVAGKFKQLYRYSLETGKTICVSCSPTGAEPIGNASVAAQVPPNVPPKTAAPVIKRNLVDQGNRVFFDTPNALVESDVNGVNDVYEWEAAGVGTCAAGQPTGCVSLISAGTSPLPSYFGDSDLSGENVFFFTSQPLVAQDGDELVDVYDARENGGIASQNVRPAPPCEAEACRGSAAVATQGATPGSSTLVGTGNSKPKKEKLPNKKHHKKKHHKKKHRKKKHRKKKQGKKKHGTKTKNNGQQKGNK